MVDNNTDMNDVYMDGRASMHGYGETKGVFGVTIFLTPEYQTWCNRRVQQYTTREGLDMESTMVNLDSTERGANKKTIDNYHGRYVELFTFCCVLGDW
jgi:hypothetical protein